MIIILISIFSSNQMSLQALKTKLKLNSSSKTKIICFSPPTGNNPDPNKIIPFNPSSALEFSETGGDLWIGAYSADKTKIFQLLLHGWGNTRSEVQSPNGTPICVNAHSEVASASRAVKIEFINGLVNYYRDGTKLWSCQTNITATLAFVNFAQYAGNTSVCVCGAGAPTTVTPTVTAPVCFSPPTGNNPDASKFITFDPTKALEFTETGGDLWIGAYSSDKTKRFQLLLHGWGNTRSEVQSPTGTPLCVNAHSENASATRAVKIEFINGLVNYYRDGTKLWSCQTNITTALSFVNFAQWSTTAKVCDVKNGSAVSTVTSTTTIKEKYIVSVLFACDRLSINTTYNWLQAYCNGGVLKTIPLAQCVHTEDDMLKDGGGFMSQCACKINSSTLHCDCNHGVYNSQGGTDWTAPRGSDWDLNKIRYIVDDNQLTC